MKRTIKRFLGFFFFVVLSGIIVPGFAELYGEVIGTKYENSFLGIGCDLPEWSFDVASDGIVTEENNLTENNETEGKRYNKNGIIMSASSSDHMQMISIRIIDAADYQDIYKTVGMEKAVQWLKDDFSSLLESMNAYDVTTNTIEVQIDGICFYGLSAEFRYMTIPIYQKQIYFFRDNDLVFLSYRSYVEDKTEDIIKHFYLINFTEE